MNNWLMYLVGLLILLILIKLQDLDLQLIPEKLKSAFSILSVVLSLISLIISCSNVVYTSVQFDMDIAKIKFVMIYLSRVVQDWFEVGLI